MPSKKASSLSPQWSSAIFLLPGTVNGWILFPVFTLLDIGAAFIAWFFLFETTDKFGVFILVTLFGGDLGYLWSHILNPKNALNVIVAVFFQGIVVISIFYNSSSSSGIGSSNRNLQFSNANNIFGSTPTEETNPFQSTTSGSEDSFADRKLKASTPAGVLIMVFVFYVLRVLYLKFSPGKKAFRAFFSSVGDLDDPGYDWLGYPSEEWLGRNFAPISLESAELLLKETPSSCCTKLPDRLHGRDCATWGNNHTTARTPPDEAAEDEEKASLVLGERENIDNDIEAIESRNAMQIHLERTVVVSYRQDPNVRDVALDRDSKFRNMKTTRVVDDGVREVMDHLDIRRFWHDGGTHVTGDGIWNKVGGAMPYVIEGNTVLVHLSGPNSRGKSGCCGRKNSDNYKHVPGSVFGNDYKELEKAYFWFASSSNFRWWKEKCCGGWKPTPPAFWAENQRFWLLAEACMGCLHGRIGLLPESRRRASIFLSTINYAIARVEEEMLRSCKCDWSFICSVFRGVKDELLQERFDRLKVVWLKLRERRLEIGRWFCLVNRLDRTGLLDEEGQVGGFTPAPINADVLGDAFLEPMSTAPMDEKFKADRITVAGMIGYMTQRVLGYGESPMFAATRYRKLDDQLVEAWYTMCAGSSIYPTFMSREERSSLNTAYALRIQDDDHLLSPKNPFSTVMSCWPQPVNGKTVFRGSMTYSKWKESFEFALRNGLNLRNMEETVTRGKPKHRCGIGLNPKYRLTIPEDNVSKETLRARDVKVKQLANRIQALQAQYHPVIGTTAPWHQYDIPGETGVRYYVVLMVDLRGGWTPVIHGESNPFSSGGEKAPWLVDVGPDKGDAVEGRDTSDTITFLPASGYTGQKFSLYEVPLFQVVFKLRATHSDQASMICMRRVWNIHKPLESKEIRALVEVPLMTSDLAGLRRKIAHARTKALQSHRNWKSGLDEYRADGDPYSLRRDCGFSKEQLREALFDEEFALARKANDANSTVDHNGASFLWDQQSDNILRESSRSDSHDNFPPMRLSFNGRLGNYAKQFDKSWFGDWTDHSDKHGRIVVGGCTGFIDFASSEEGSSGGKHTGVMDESAASMDTGLRTDREMTESEVSMEIGVEQPRLVKSKEKMGKRDSAKVGADMDDLPTLENLAPTLWSRRWI